MSNSINQDDRLTKTGSDSRADRAMNDRAVTQNRELTEKERLETFRRSLHQSALPDLPNIPGYRVYWATTTNARDTPFHRMSLGFELIKSSEIPGFEHVSAKQGEFAGCISVNEMVAMKIPEELWQLYMTEAHHTMPLEEDGKLTATLDVIRETAERGKSRVYVEEGMQELSQPVKAPVFA